MATAETSLTGVLGRLTDLPAKLVGPVFLKELRVASRRRRSYVLRTAYVLALTLFVALVYLSVVRWEGLAPTAWQAARMADAGAILASCIVGFQFGVAVLVAMVLLSGSISEEISRRTLGVLMSTPVGGFQIVLGKLAGGMLQVATLLAISLPLLAILRVLGGVSWGPLVACLCLTLATAVFFAALSMLFSIFFRRPHAALIATAGVGAVLFGASFLIAVALIDVYVRTASGMGTMTSTLLYTNPFFAVAGLIRAMVDPRAVAALGSFHWPITCAVVLAGTAAVMAVSARLVRRAALRQAVGSTDAAPAPSVPGRARRRSEIREIIGSPVVWRELHAPWARRGRLGALSVVGFAAIAALLYVLVGLSGGWRRGDRHAWTAVVLVSVAAMVTAVVSAAAITSEKQSRCWDVLLSTPLTGGDIAWGKAVGVLKRAGPFWLLPVAHAALFIPLGLVHFVGAFHAALVCVPPMLLLTGTGLYLSARLRQTATAVVANLVFAVLWLGLPWLMFFLSRRLGEEVILFNPPFQAGTVLFGASGKEAHTSLAELRYHWPGAGRAWGVVSTTALLAVFAAIHAGVGALFIRRAARRVRGGPR